MDDVRKCSKCKTFSSKSIFYSDISTKDGLNPICKICRRGYYEEHFDKNKNYREQYDENRKETDLNFKLACNLRSRSSKAFNSQNSRKTNKTFDLLGCSHSFFQRWIIHQLYGNLTIGKIVSVWQIDHFLPMASINFSDENDMKQCFNWIILRPMYSNEKRKQLEEG